MQILQESDKEQNVLKRYSEYLFGLLLLSLLLFLPYRKIDPVLNIYYNTMTYVLNKECPSKKYYNPRQVEIKFDNLQGQTIGICMKGINKYVIKIDSSWWSEANQDDRFQLAVHELSHCMLNAEHVDISGHFMAPQFQPLPMRDVIIQLKELIKEKCI